MRGMHEVLGSIPISSTSKINELPYIRVAHFYFEELLGAQRVKSAVGSCSMQYFRSPAKEHSII